jgi:hypothetical protein
LQATTTTQQQQKSSSVIFFVQEGGWRGFENKIRKKKTLYFNICSHKKVYII